MGGQSYEGLYDPQSRTAIDYGLYGVPETFFIGRDGRVAYKHVGAVTTSLVSWIRCAPYSRGQGSDDTGVGVRLGALLLRVAATLSRRTGACARQEMARKRQVFPDWMTPFDAVSSQLRCPVCQGESIQESPADLAKQMRYVVRDQLAAGRSPATK